MYCRPASFLPRDTMHSANYAAARCPSVCFSVDPSFRPSVTLQYSVKTAKHVIKLFHHGNHTKRHGNIPMGHPLYGDIDIECRRYEKSPFSTNILLYLGKHTR